MTMQTLRYTLRRYWYISALVVILIGTIILRVATSLIPEPPTTQTEVNTWNTLIPGYSTKASVTEKLGQPLQSVPTENGESLEYSAPFAEYPTVVEVDSTQKVRFVRERFDPRDQSKVPAFVAKLGAPDFIQYSVGGAFPLEVHLRYGVAVARHLSDKSVFEIWYFPPMSKQEFLSTIGKDNATESDEPELAPDLQEASPSAQTSY